MKTVPNDETMELLVGYALDSLEPAEMEQIKQLLIEQPELRQTIAELRAVADTLPYALPSAEPPADLRQRALDRALGRSSAPTTTPTPLSTPSRAPRNWWSALFGGLAGVAGVAAIFFALQWNATQQELAQTQQQLIEVQRDQQQLAQFVSNPLNVSALEGSAGSATIFYAEDGSGLLAANLPQIAADRVYQLWVIDESGVPASAGVFQVDAQGTAIFPIKNDRPLAGTTLAVTNEPAPGSLSPTSDILLVGTLDI